jgi:ribose 5-phosphate isomerase A
MSQEEAKRRAAEAAAELVAQDMIIGVGTGSTVNQFIDVLGQLRFRIPGAVSSSTATTERLQKLGIRVLELNDTGDLELYVDGADEATSHLQLVKGGGGALTREKVIAAAARKFVCMVDESKMVDVLGRFPLPVEVLPMARSYVARQLVKLSGQPVLREGFVTDNGNQILDVRNLRITDPAALESRINQIPGVVTVGVFAQRPADLLIVGSPTSVRKLTRQGATRVS